METTEIRAAKHRAEAAIADILNKLASDTTLIPRSVGLELIDVRNMNSQAPTFCVNAKIDLQLDI